MIGDNFKGSKFGKFASGFGDEGVDSKANKAVDTLKNDKLDKVGKFSEITKQLRSYKVPSNPEPKPIVSNSVLTNTSNGHVPVGYPATSETSSSNAQSVVPTGSTSLLIKQDKKKNKKKENKKENKKQTKHKSNTTKKKPQKNKDTQLKNYRAKLMNTKAKGKKKK